MPPIEIHQFFCRRACVLGISVVFSFLSGLKPQCNRKLSQCGCQAYLCISKVSDGCMHEWWVTGFENCHNHKLLEPEQVHFLQAYRIIFYIWLQCSKGEGTEVCVEAMCRLMLVALRCKARIKQRWNPRFYCSDARVEKSSEAFVTVISSHDIRALKRFSHREYIYKT